MRALIFGLCMAGPAFAQPADTHPFPWITGQQLVHMLNSGDKTAEAVAYLKGVFDATADREWCYSKTKPNTALLQPALTEFVSALPTAEARKNAGVLAVRAWKLRWPCLDTGCCHV